ncbi:MAG: hypothetical protein LBS93_05505 [Synergistaceae bacterium]|nr:hypothetical protein [Synergistaceae bacterium]
MNEPVVLCESEAIRPMPRWMTAASAILGIALLYGSYTVYSAGGGQDKFLFSALLGILLIYAAGLNRRMYLSDVGIVRETKIWGRLLRRVLPWGDVKHVSLAFRGTGMTAFFEVSLTGWRVPFSGEQERDVLGVITDMIPDIEINLVGKD